MKTDRIRAVRNIKDRLSAVSDIKLPLSFPKGNKFLSGMSFSAFGYSLKAEGVSAFMVPMSVGHVGSVKVFDSTGEAFSPGSSLIIGSDQACFFEIREESGTIERSLPPLCKAIVFQIRVFRTSMSNIIE